MIYLRGVCHYWGIEIKRSCQAKMLILLLRFYLKTALVRFEMTDGNSISTSMDSDVLITMVFSMENYQASAETICWYSSAVGFFIYTMTMTRLDIAFTFDCELIPQ